MTIDKCMRKKCNTCKDYNKCFPESRCKKLKSMQNSSINQKHGKSVEKLL